MPVWCIWIGPVREPFTEPRRLQLEYGQLADAAEPSRTRMQRETCGVMRGHRHSSGSAIHVVRRIGVDIDSRPGAKEAPLGTASRATSFVFAHRSVEPGWDRDNRTVHWTIVARQAEMWA